MHLIASHNFLLRQRAQHRRVGLAALLLVGWPALAAAQRSEVPAPHTVTTPSRLDNFPGNFNAAMLEPGHWTLDVLPLPSLYYGLHADATVRVGLVQLAAFAKGYGFSGELRYRIWHRGNTSMVASLAGSLMHLNVKLKAGEQVAIVDGSLKTMPVYETGLDVRSAQVTVTGEHRWTSRSATAITLLGGGLVLSTERPVASGSKILLHTTQSLQGAGGMLSHSYFPARWFGIDAGVGVTPYFNASLASAGGGADIDLTRLASSRAGFSGRFNLHLRTRHWLTTLGAVILPPYIPVPVIGVSRSW